MRACVESGVDYLDICGEPEFMERMEHIFHETAVQRNSLIVSSCGFDCIPAEMGVLHAVSLFLLPNFPPKIRYLTLVYYFLGKAISTSWSSKFC